MGRPLLVWFFALAGICQSQPVTVTPSSISGVEIQGSQAVDFGSHADRILGEIRSELLNAWLPYAVLLQNHTSQTLVAVAVRWEVEDAQRRRSSLVQMEKAWSLSPRLQITPGKCAVALPRFGIQTDPAHLTAPLRTSSSQPVASGIANDLHRFQSSESMKVSLDGVVFQSGQFAGPNAAHEYEDWIAETTVPPQVAAKVLEMKGAGVQTPQIVSWLQSESEARPRDWAARTAAWLLQVYKDKGEQHLFEQAQTESQPMIHIHR